MSEGQWQGQASWERLPGESLTWYQRFERFRLMVPVRSIAAVYHKEQEAKDSVKPRKPTSSKVPGDWYDIAKQWKWEERAAAWDASETARLEAIIAYEQEQVLRAGYALLHKRVEVLTEVAFQLKKYMDDEKKVWPVDVKIVATGQGQAERADSEYFNHELFKEFRACLDDIAAEVGGRTKKNDVNLSGQVIVREAPPGFFDS